MLSRFSPRSENLLPSCRRVSILAVAILLLRRIPAVLALCSFLNPLRGIQDALFVRWFGPIGVAALFYAMLSLRQTGVGLGGCYPNHLRFHLGPRFNRCTFS